MVRLKGKVLAVGQGAVAQDDEQRKKFGAEHVG